MKRSRNIGMSVSFTVLAATLATGVTACGDDDQVMYCGDDQRYIVEEDKCEDNDPNTVYFIYYGYWGGYKYSPGKQLDQTHFTGRVKASDSAARKKLGLPERGGFGGNGNELPDNDPKKKRRVGG